MAELLTADPAAGATIKLDGKAQAELKKTRCPKGCATGSRVAGQPGDESLVRKLQSFSPWN